MYEYGSLGIAFMLDESDVCVGIAIFPVGPPEPGGGIVAGRSVEGVEIGFTRAQVIEKLGDPSKIDEEGNRFFYDFGVVVWFNGRVVWIAVIPPYSGTTERGIGLGATASDITRQYGIANIFDWSGIYWPTTPDQEYKAYDYVSLGITFILDESSDICVSIIIYGW